MDPAIPAGFALVRRIGPFTADTLPRGLLGEHRLKPDRWGHLTLEAGAVRLVWDDGSSRSEDLAAPAQALIPPEVPHHLEFTDDFVLRIDFLQQAG
ncbi:DUF1971 domain-containing protein [Alteraurantiacibacter buctensis]|uniref:DUF1971 domain-containing protein n=1 Tax=Alteraurantiacibacter buctensis TaxID=1503981 RepID=A0A844YYQ6_9SPHN|nr:DUF1971 domain-containing protein [Alteraurantiacibacter buctensis]MXO71594.1 DUF1971 domain-containing protein [Alteraurantiacibacter buctensis]